MRLSQNPQSAEPMRTFSALPQTQLSTAGDVTAAFLERCVRTYRDAALVVFRLPYGRTASRTDPIAVLKEGHGTCSSKHALLAALAIEQKLPINLMLGIYLMHERNTPGVGPVLARYGLKEIPEAHCYLGYGGGRVDVTREIDSAPEPIALFLHEEAISPEQIGAYKVGMHREFLRGWLRQGRLGGGWTFKRLWQAREECIAALAG